MLEWRKNRSIVDLTPMAKPKKDPSRKELLAEMNRAWIAYKQATAQCTEYIVLLKSDDYWDGGVTDNGEARTE